MNRWCVLSVDDVPALRCVQCTPRRATGAFVSLLQKQIDLGKVAEAFFMLR